MKVLLYADYRSSHAQGWYKGLVDAGISVVAVSSEVVTAFPADSPADPVSRRRQMYVVNRSAAAEQLGDGGSSSAITRVLLSLINSQTMHSLVHFSRARYLNRRLRSIVQREKPDLVHALRIPYEGVTAVAAKLDVPVVVSTWGSDIDPQSTSDPILARWTRKVLRRVSGFQYDSTQDLARGLKRGLRPQVPTLHAAGNFGVENSLFYVEASRRPGIVVYPRRAKPNANYRGFVAAAIDLSAKYGVRFVGVGLQSAAAELAEEFGAEQLSRVELTGQLTRVEMAALLRSAQIVVSPTLWDGTPISVLEALAAGCKVIAGSLPELMRLKEEGMDIELIDASSTSAIAEAIELALQSGATGDPNSLPVEFNRVANQTRATVFYTEVLEGYEDR